MTEINDPGAPRTDELARKAARNALIAPLTSITDGTGITEDAEAIGAIADAVTRNHTVTWERDVNAAGVPVRCYVLRGGWEVDPETKPIERDDVVRYRDRRDDGREWTVGEAFPPGGHAPDHAISMTSPGLDEMIEHRYARAGELEVVRKARP